jgi:hypothetical protein
MHTMPIKNPLPLTTFIGLLKTSGTTPAVGLNYTKLLNLRGINGKRLIREKFKSNNHI